MRVEAPHRRRGAVERLVGWLYMGPLGHLYSVVADLAVYFVRWVLRGAKRRVGCE